MSENSVNRFGVGQTQATGQAAIAREAEIQNVLQGGQHSSVPEVELFRGAFVDPRVGVR